MTGEEIQPLRMKQLVVDGVWQVPAGERPRGWESMGGREPDESPIVEPESSLAIPAEAPTSKRSHHKKQSVTVARSVETTQKTTESVTVEEETAAPDANPEPA